jgi:hypothetical protein
MDESVGVLGAWGRLEMDLWVFVYLAKKRWFGSINLDCCLKFE